MTASASELQTDRLLLRRWTPDDREPFFRINSDPVVCEFLPKRLTREESDSFAERVEQHFDRHGFGLWAVEVPQVAPFIGFVRLQERYFRDDPEQLSVREAGELINWLQANPSLSVSC